MIKAVACPSLSAALEKLKEEVTKNEIAGKKTVIFCEDRLTLAAERAVCAANGGTFLTSVYTFARFLTSEKGKAGGVLSSRGSAMAVRRIMEEHKSEFKVFKKPGTAGAAQSVYDTIALLYASRVSAEHLKTASNAGGMLGNKLSDIALVYTEYEKYLKESGLQDRNGYLKQLPAVIETSRKIAGAYVIFLGFQAFTGTTSECVRAAFSAADGVWGLFVSGGYDLYVNESYGQFTAMAAEFGGAEKETAVQVLNEDAEVLRARLFNPFSYHMPPEKCSSVRVLEASDSEEELEFIAASIKKHVLDFDERYAKISVMLPDLAGKERSLSRVFARYKIPYFADIRYPLSGHSLGAFILSFLRCVQSGCRMKDVNEVVASPLFPAGRRDKDMFRNYMLRFCTYRGGVRRAPKQEFLQDTEFDTEAIERVRTVFIKGLDIFKSDGGKSGICAGVRRLLEEYKVEESLKNLYEKFRDDKPLAAGFCTRAYEAAESVLAEAESIAGENLPLSEFVKLLSTGFAAMEISIIPPKSDAVFVGDIASTVNIGSNVVFAAGLTNGVPAQNADTALITDREIALLESVNVNISPRIGQVNARMREVIALNVCAFKKALYLTYPAQSGGEECTPSEIILYAQAIFCTPSGSNLKRAELSKVVKSQRSAPYYCSEMLPALARLKSGGDEAAAIYSVLAGRGFKEQADEVLKKPRRGVITRGGELYLKHGSLSPTTLETYFSCPYLAFIRQGLCLKEREEGEIRAADTGNFIHSVLQDAAQYVDGTEYGEFENKARALAAEKLSKPPYSALADSKSGQYLTGELISEAVEVSKGMYLQLKNSQFKVVAVESKCTVELFDGVKVYGRIDRVDQCGDMVRIIDYKSGKVDCSPSKYYTGAKLQLPLYLLSASEGKRAVGAYYFPAAVDYSAEKDGVFRLRGFMDGSSEVVRASDSAVEPKKKSEYVDAYLEGRSVDAAMPAWKFPYFLEYSKLVAGTAAKEMLDGNIVPSPAEDVCEYCRAGGSCSYSAVRDGGERKSASVKCSRIAEIVKQIKEDGNE